MAPCRPLNPRADPTAGILTRSPCSGCSNQIAPPRPPVDDTPSAHLHEESDPGPFLPIECQVDEGRDAYQVEAAGRDVTARDGDRLDGLVDGASPDGVNLDTLLTPDDSCDGPGH